MNRSKVDSPPCIGEAPLRPTITRRRAVTGAIGVAALALVPPGLAETLRANELTNGRNKTTEIKRNGSRPSAKGPDAYFTGTVRVDPMFQVGEPARVSGGHVTFEPGARSAWHTHPLGQT